MILRISCPPRQKNVAVPGLLFLFSRCGVLHGAVPETKIGRPGWWPDMKSQSGESWYLANAKPQPVPIPQSGFHACAIAPSSRVNTEGRIARGDRAEYPDYGVQATGGRSLAVEWRRRAYSTSLLYQGQGQASARLNSKRRAKTCSPGPGLDRCRVSFFPTWCVEQT